MTRSQRALLVLIALLTSVVLVLTAGRQIYDTNFYTLWEATALLAGDHPYRDFYEWGVPLQALVSAGAQQLVGYRLIGEFAVQWLFIVAGVLIAWHLGQRLSRSIAASLVAMSLALIVLASTPTFHYPKLFLYPLAIWLAWWYLDRPGLARSAVLAVATVVAFLFRHDHGVYFGAAALLAFGLARLVIPASRSPRAFLAEGATYAVTAAVLLMPWLVVVQINEGLPAYVRSRAQLYGEWSASQSPFRFFVLMNPVGIILGDELPPPTPRTVSFNWVESVEDAQRQELERRHGLRRHAGPDENGRWQYEVPNAYDVTLLELASDVNNTEGIDWELLRANGSPLPTREEAQALLCQISLLIPILLLGAAVLDLVRRRWHGEEVPMDTYRILFAAVFLAAIERRLFRETSYFVVVAPLTAAFGGRLLGDALRVTRTNGRTSPRIWLARAGRAGAAAVACAVLLIATVATAAYASDFNPIELAGTVEPAFHRLLVSPPIEGLLPADAVRHYDRDAWKNGAVDKGLVLMRYVRDCTGPGDRVLVTGSTPYHVGYYVERPVAGGQVFWHHRWRSDPEHDTQSLTLLQSQSVPFALSTHDPVLEDFKPYPKIREYLMKDYVELEGSDGHLLIDTRRRPTRQYGALGFPCFN